MMVACLLPDNGSLNVIRRSMMPFGNPVSFPTRSDLMAKPTPASFLSSVLRPLQSNRHNHVAAVQQDQKKQSQRTACAVVQSNQSLGERGGLVVNASDSGSRGRGFEPLTGQTVLYP